MRLAALLESKWLFPVLLIISGVLGLALSLHLHPIAAPASDIAGLPKGTVTIKTFHYPISFIEQLKGDPHAGKKIFAEYCHSCHGVNPVIPINAPRINDKKAWQALSKLGLDKLAKIAADGVAAMPARGGCFECSDAQLKMTVEYILHQALRAH